MGGCSRELAEWPGRDRGDEPHARLALGVWGLLVAEDVEGKGIGGKRVTEKEEMTGNGPDDWTKFDAGGCAEQRQVRCSRARLSPPPVTWRYIALWDQMAMEGT